MGWVTHIWSGLVVDGDRVYSREPGIDEEGDQRVEDRADEHDAFAEQYED